MKKCSFHLLCSNAVLKWRSKIIFFIFSEHLSCVCRDIAYMISDWGISLFISALQWLLGSPRMDVTAQTFSSWSIACSCDGGLKAERG